MKKQFLKICLVASMLLSGLTHAQEFEGDRGLQGVLDAGLATEINESQTIDGYTVTLKWAYADEHRFAFSYDVEGLIPDDPSLQPGALFMDDQGNIFSFSSGSMMTDGTTGIAEVINNFYTHQASAVDQNGQWSMKENYFADVYGETPDEINFQLQIFIGEGTMMWIDPIDAQDNQVQGAIGGFKFNFTLPIYKAITLEPQQTVEANGLAVTLENIKISPSQTQARICFPLPDQKDWQPVATLTIGDQEGQPSGVGMSRLPLPEDTERCFDLSMNLLYDGTAQNLTFTLEKLQTSEPTESFIFWEKVSAEMEKHGIEIEYTLNNAVIRNIISKPDGMTDEEIWQLEMQIREDLRPAMVGPWVFTIELP